MPELTESQLIALHRLVGDWQPVRKCTANALFRADHTTFACPCGYYRGERHFVGMNMGWPLYRLEGHDLPMPPADDVFAMKLQELLLIGVFPADDGKWAAEILAGEQDLETGFYATVVDSEADTPRYAILLAAAKWLEANPDAPERRS